MGGGGSLSGLTGIITSRLLVAGCGDFLFHQVAKICGVVADPGLSYVDSLPGYSNLNPPNGCPLIPGDVQLFFIRRDKLLHSPLDIVFSHIPDKYCG